VRTLSPPQTDCLPAQVRRSAATCVQPQRDKLSRAGTVEWYLTLAAETPVAMAPGDTGTPIAKVGTIAMPLIGFYPPEWEGDRRRRRPITRCCCPRAGLAGCRSRPRALRPSSSSTAGIGDWQPAATCCRRPRSVPRWLLTRPGWMCSAPAAGQAGRLICAPSTVTHWLRSARWCSACGVRGVRDRRRCRSCLGFTRCHRQNVRAPFYKDARRRLKSTPCLKYFAA
jgi:hypothetical protein